MDPRILAVALLATALAAPAAAAGPLDDYVDVPILGDGEGDCSGWIDTNCYHHTSYPYRCSLYVHLPTDDGSCWMYFQR